MEKVPPFTTGVVALCILIALTLGLGSSLESMRPLFLTDVVPGAGLDAVSQGEFWRLLSPIFLHFSIMHIAFNMIWLWQLGGALEARMGWLEVLMAVFVFGVVSNLAEYLANPNIIFGGMSGVVYGLLGYFWVQGRLNPRFGMRLNKPIVIMMLVWFVICWLGLVGNIANVAHTAGLVVGVAWGYGSVSVGRP